MQYIFKHQVCRLFQVQDLLITNLIYSDSHGYMNDNLFEILTRKGHISQHISLHNCQQFLKRANNDQSERKELPMINKNKS